MQRFKSIAGYTCQKFDILAGIVYTSVNILVWYRYMKLWCNSMFWWQFNLKYTHANICGIVALNSTSVLKIGRLGSYIIKALERRRLHLCILNDNVLDLSNIFYQYIECVVFKHTFAHAMLKIP